MAIAKKVSAIGESCSGGESTGNEKCRIAEVMESYRTGDAAAEKSGDNEKAESSPLQVHGKTPEGVTQKDPEVSEHARNVGRVNNDPAVSAYHGVLETAGTGRE